MLRYLVARVLGMIVMIVLATLVVFIIASLVPADPILAQLGDMQAADEELVAAYRAKWGLDLPLWQQYWIFLTKLVHGDFGISISSQRPVLADIAQYAPATIELSTIAFVLAVVVGVPLGVLAAVRRDSWIDHVARLLSLIGVSAPTFWLAFIMLALFYGGLRIAPGPGRLDVVFLPPPTVTGLYLIDAALAGQWDVFQNAAAHLVLPSIVLAATTLGLITRTTRAAMLEALNQDYVRVARAKGMAEWAIVRRHALPNALIPVVTLGRPRLCRAAQRHGADRDHLLLAGPRPLHLPQRRDARLPGDHGHHLHRRRGLSRDQPDRRSVLRAARPARGAQLMATAVVQPAAAGGLGRKLRRGLRRYWLAALGGAIVLAWILIAIVSPYVVPYPPEALDVTKRLLPPSAIHWLGTDMLGRDVFSRLLVGAQVSLFAGFTVALLGAAIGTLVGGIAAYAGGKVEEAHDAAHRPDAVLPADHPRDGDRGSARHRRHQHADRDAGGLVAEVRPPRAQPGDRPAQPGIRRGRRRGRLRPGPHPVPPHHAERARAVDRAGDARRRPGDPDLLGPLASSASA